MYTTLDQLAIEQKPITRLQRINRWVEIRNIVALLLTVSVISYTFINFNLIKLYAGDLLGWVDNTPTTAYAKTVSIQPLITDTNPSPEHIEALLDSSKIVHDITYHPTELLAEYITRQVKAKPFMFNLLPPNDMLLIHSDDVVIQAPIIQPTSISLKKLQKGDFTTELRNGTLLYPGTSMTEGLAVIAGHSSSESFNTKNTAFGTIFAKLNKLEPDDTFHIIVGGQKRYYQIVDKQVIKPSKFKHFFQKRNAKALFHQKHMMTLVTCWPLGTTLNRLMVTAQEITPPAS